MIEKKEYQLKSTGKSFKYAGVFITFFILLTSTSFGQSITWQRTYDGPAHYNDRAYSLTPADGNNFYAVGSTVISGYYHYILKLNELGDTLWTRSIQLNPGFGDFSLSSISDGYDGVVVTGDNDTSFTMKLDKNGNIVWYKNYNMIAAMCNKIIKKNSDGYLICGKKQSSDDHGYVLNIDTSGNLLWQNLYLSTEYKNYNDVLEFNNGFYLAGTVTDAPIDTQQVLLTKINYSGDVQWEKRYTILGRDGNGQIIERLNDKIFIAGTTTDSILSEARGYFMTIDNNGNEISTKVLQATKSEILQDLLILNENRLLFILTSDSSFYISTTRVIVTDLSGNIIYEKHFVPPQNEGDIHLVSAMKTSNGDLIFAGNSYIDTNATSEDVFVARTDSMLYAPPISIQSQNINVTEQFRLYQNFPNPFNPVTNIKYEIPKDVNVSIKIYDILGREVFSFNEYKKAGSYEVQFDGSDFASGMYFYKLETDGFSDTKKMVLLK